MMTRARGIGKRKRNTLRVKGRLQVLVFRACGHVRPSRTVRRPARVISLLRLYHPDRHGMRTEQAT